MLAATGNKPVDVRAEAIPPFLEGVMVVGGMDETADLWKRSGTG